MSRTGLIFVSHSRKLAEGVKELLENMQPEAVTAACGGEEDGGIGTNPEVIQRGIESLEGCTEAVILTDLGSAWMNAEIASEISSIPVLLADAPLVEGGLAAVVEAGFGKDAAAVKEAAEKAWDMRKST
ncbi:dihydroxyacetone kinase phosphoryl donor subunit DhaM [Alkalicoccus urumqiensis]|uniref:phosphoenolpyruvate--glycerone phosphotransferase n=1 Tax=Alkalicoccus urumqiensis TaxID=1548213 RepID=A0A2P6MD66_ALKUR|nr:dihydroxyacetone kinase phosphoryl donor subunit DhaM [Alkalicoccus urumqiensis]PRO64226.1 dihydroxyacetone kinase [Alkalicoccus urumqiensis]